jgi:hypothetical protein
MRASLNTKRTGHAEVHDQHIPRRQFGDQIFRAAAEGLYPLPLESAAEVAGEGNAQVAPARDDAFDARAIEHGAQFTKDYLDFRELGH